MAEDKEKDDSLTANEAGVVAPPLDYVFGLPTDPAGTTDVLALPDSTNIETSLAPFDPSSNSGSTNLLPIPTSTDVVPNPMGTDLAPKPTSTDVVPNPISTDVVSNPMGTNLLPKPGGAGVPPAPNPNTADSAAAEPSMGVSPSNLPYTLPPSAVAPESIVSKEDKFAVDEVIGFGWRAMTKYFWPLCGILASNYLVQSVPAVAVMVLNYSGSNAGMSMASMLISLFGLLLNMIISLGTLTLWLKICDGETITTRDVYSKMGLVWRYMMATFLFGSMVALGTLCLIVPGIYLFLRFQFYGYFIVESEAGPLKALKASYAITKGSVAELFFLSIINYFIGWVGWMILLVGVFPAQVIQNVALARTYRQLRGNTPESDLPPGLQPIPMIIETENSKNA